MQICFDACSIGSSSAWSNGRKRSICVTLLRVRVFGSMLHFFLFPLESRDFSQDFDLPAASVLYLNASPRSGKLTLALSTADPSLDWRLIENTLKHIRNLTNDTAILKNKYSLTLYEDSDSAALVPSNGEQARTNTFGSFKKFFSQSNSQSSTAAARVIQSKNHPMKKLWWAAVDKSDFKRLVEDISHFTQRLYVRVSGALAPSSKSRVEV